MRKLGEGVGGHDRAGEIFGRGLAEVGGQYGSGLFPQVHLELRADDAGGGGKDGGRIKARSAANQLKGEAAIPHALVAGARVGLPGIDDHGPRLGAFGKHGLRDHDRGGGKTVLRERPGGHSRDIADEKGQIGAVFLAEAGRGHGKTETLRSDGHDATLLHKKMEKRSMPRLHSTIKQNRAP